MEENNKISNLMNYELNNSNSSNYLPSQTSSSPDSFPNIMEEGILVEYKEIIYTSEILKEEVPTGE